MDIYRAKLCIFATALLLAAQTSVFAQTPYKPDLVQGGNRWIIADYDDSASTHPLWAQQGICFYYAGTRGSHQQYVWVSDTYPDWNGRAVQEGDQIFMHGDFQWPPGNRDGGHDGMEWQLTTMSRRDEGFGHWKEWVEDGRYGMTIVFANAKLNRVGKCLHTTYEEAHEAGTTLELPIDDQGRVMNNPAGVGLDLIQ